MKAKLITNKSNIQYLSNFTGSAGFILKTDKKTYLFTDFRYIERAENTIKKGIKIINTSKMWRNKEVLKKNWGGILARHKVKTLGIEENDLTVDRYKKFKKITQSVAKGIKFEDISNDIAKIREIKNAEEIKIIRKSQRINEEVFSSIKKIIQTKVRAGKHSDLREIDLAWKIKELGREFGAEDVSFDPIVAFGKHSASPHHSPDNSKLKKGQIVLIDMGMKFKGYCSDMTRMVFPQKPKPFEAEIYNLVLEAQMNGLKQIKAGQTGAVMDAFSRDIIKNAGYGDQYGHSGGHGIGLDIHESPALSEFYKKPILENTIITVEPGIYLPGKFGVRIEDMTLVKKNGNKNLTKIPKEI